MSLSDKNNWLIHLPKQVQQFLSSLQSEIKPGYYRYSVSGDLFDEKTRWGLGNAVFAAKILFMLDAASPHESTEIGNFISSFQDEKGFIFDPVVEKLSRLSRWGGAIKRLDLNNLFNQQTRRAESRQAFAALRCLGKVPSRPFPGIPLSNANVEKFVQDLDWSQPWNAGSHVSHLLFFLNAQCANFELSRQHFESLIECVKAAVNIYHRTDGSWYSPNGQMPAHMKINAAMKILTGFEAAGIRGIENPENLVDLCLQNVNDGHACNNFNITYVLYRCSECTDYRRSEISSFLESRLDIYRKHYWHEYGGFSFYERHANPVYYSARITRGLPEADIHGTVLFLWGIALISRVIQLPISRSLRLPIT